MIDWEKNKEKDVFTEGFSVIEDYDIVRYIFGLSVPWQKNLQNLWNLQSDQCLFSANEMTGAWGLMDSSRMGSLEGWDLILLPPLPHPRERKSGLKVKLITSVRDLINHAYLM